MRAILKAIRAGIGFGSGTETMTAGTSGEYSTASYLGLVVAMDSVKAKPLKSLAGLQ